MNTTTVQTDRVTAWLERLCQETDHARHSEEMTRYLRAMGRFWSYSYNNQILILEKLPTATRVGGRTTLWEPLGYTIKKDAWPHKIWIQRPEYKVVEDEDTGEKRRLHVGYRWAYVFDISQVEAGPHAQLLSAPWTAITSDYADLSAVLVQVCQRLSISVAWSDTFPAYIHGDSDGKGHIRLSTATSPGDQAHTLIHELAHEVCHPHHLRSTFSKQEVECQAEAVAYCVATALGMDTPNSPTYLAFYGVTPDVLKANTSAIQHGVHRILSEVEGVHHLLDDAQSAA